MLIDDIINNILLKVLNIFCINFQPFYSVFVSGDVSGLIMCKYNHSRLRAVRLFYVLN